MPLLLPRSQNRSVDDALVAVDLASNLAPPGCQSCCERGCYRCRHSFKGIGCNGAAAPLQALVARAVAIVVVTGAAAPSKALVATAAAIGAVAGVGCGGGVEVVVVVVVVVVMVVVVMVVVVVVVVVVVRSESCLSCCIGCRSCCDRGC